MKKFTAERTFPVMESELITLRKDAARYQEARKNPGGFNHLLSLMIKEQSAGKGDRAEALDSMMDKIIASRKNAILAEAGERQS